MSFVLFSCLVSASHKSVVGTGYQERGERGDADQRAVAKTHRQAAHGTRLRQPSILGTKRNTQSKHVPAIVVLSVIWFVVCALHELCFCSCIVMKLRRLFARVLRLLVFFLCHNLVSRFCACSLLLLCLPVAFSPRRWLFALWSGCFHALQKQCAVLCNLGCVAVFCRRSLRECSSVLVIKHTLTHTEKHIPTHTGEHRSAEAHAQLHFVHPLRKVRNGTERRREIRFVCVLLVVCCCGIVVCFVGLSVALAGLLILMCYIP